MRKQTFSRIKSIGILLAVLIAATFTIASASAIPTTGGVIGGYNNNGHHGGDRNINGYWGDYWYPGHVNIGGDHLEGFDFPPGPSEYRMAGFLAHYSGDPLFETNYPGDGDRYGHFFHKLERRGFA